MTARLLSRVTGEPLTTVLSERELDVLWLYGHDGLPMKQVATYLGVALETGKSYLKRIRVKLRARGIPADARVDLFRAALGECRHRPEAMAARSELLAYLLSPGAPERAG